MTLANKKSRNNKQNGQHDFLPMSNMREQNFLNAFYDSAHTDTTTKGWLLEKK